MITADPKRVKAAGDSFREMTSLGDKKPDQIQVRVRSKGRSGGNGRGGAGAGFDIRQSNHSHPMY
jgi:hypothetical protein